MSALPSISPDQIGLFDPLPPETTLLCKVCKQKRDASLFKWESKKRGIRSDVCNTCRFGGYNPETHAEQVDGGYKGKKYPKQLIETPLASAFDPQPSACWMKRGDCVPVMLNNELTGQTVIGFFQVVSVTNTDKLRRQGRYTALRNAFMKRGYQLMEMRRSISAALIECTARQGR